MSHLFLYFVPAFRELWGFIIDKSHDHLFILEDEIGSM